MDKPSTPHRDYAKGLRVISKAKPEPKAKQVLDVDGNVIHIGDEVLIEYCFGYEGKYYVVGLDYDKGKAICYNAGPCEYATLCGSSLRVVKPKATISNFDYTPEQQAADMADYFGTLWPTTNKQKPKGIKNMIRKLTAAIKKRLDPDKAAILEAFTNDDDTINWGSPELCDFILDYFGDKKEFVAAAKAHIARVEVEQKKHEA